MSQNKGAISREAGDKGIRETWARCEQMSAGREDGALFVPWEAIVVNERILPRHIDGETVDRYAGVAADLPPITVQRETYVLIDGLHRLRAAPKAGRDMILVREADVPDDGLALAAFEANLSNGLPYTLGQRVDGAKLMLGAHPDWSNNLIARKCGVDPETVAKHRHRMEAYSERRTGADGKNYPAPQVSENRVPDLALIPPDEADSERNPEYSPGVARSTARKTETEDDWLARHKKEDAPKASSKPKVSSFDPGPEPEPDDDPGEYQARTDSTSAPANPGQIRGDVPRRVADAPLPQAVVSKGPEFMAACDWLSIGPDVDAVAFGRELKRLGKEGTYWLNIAVLTLEWLAAAIEEAER